MARDNQQNKRHTARSGSAGGSFDLAAYMTERAGLVERELAARVAAADGPATRLYEAMRYSLFGGGKRLRPILALAACEAVGGRMEAALDLACAVEMVHNYSLIHDDLPCMDDDDLRHGHPSNHMVYGDAIATLAGDALLTDAFAIAARSPAPPNTVLETLGELAAAAGSCGMVAGQVIDLTSEGRTLALEELEYLHARKTGALFLVAVRGGARLGGASAEQLKKLEAYARALGLAFQVADDLLDVEASTAQMGKRTHKDDAAGKNTYPALLGLEESHGVARRLQRRAQEALKGFDRRADPLRFIAAFAVERKL